MLWPHRWASATSINLGYAELCSNPSYAQALEDAVLLPLEKQGLDYWWIDWQQGGNHGGCKGKKQNPTIWTNKIRATDHVRRGTDKRGLVLARWGGLGSHRYQVGFSGDVKDVSWDNLAYQPYFSMTATNVAYGFWSHDIVGPSGSNTDDLELFTRWLQWASYSGCCFMTAVLLQETAQAHTQQL